MSLSQRRPVVTCFAGRKNLGSFELPVSAELRMIWLHDLLSMQLYCNICNDPWFLAHIEPNRRRNTPSKYWGTWMPCPACGGGGLFVLEFLWWDSVIPQLPRPLLEWMLCHAGILTNYKEAA